VITLTTFITIVLLSTSYEARQMWQKDAFKFRVFAEYEFPTLFYMFVYYTPISHTVCGVIASENDE
jgi:hypothetical protein